MRKNKISPRVFLGPFFLLLALAANSQAPQTWTSSDMFLALRKLNVLGSVLYVAAHPDDENTRLIAYFSKDRMLRTGYLSMTRGDGGQNLIGDEQGVELGLIRTQELLAARRVDGGEQFFTRAFDFGYSKTADETFDKWDKEKILSDVVWVIRNFRPDVIITRFPTTGEGGHGHHTGSAILANEAFTAAADPKRFPEHLKWVQPWQAKRILWNSFNFGGVNLTSSDQFKFDVGGYNPLLGQSYGEIAAISRSNHKSQGFGSAGSRGEAFEYFKATGGDAPVNDLFEGIDLSWNRVPGGREIAGIVDSLVSSFNLLHPERSVKGLVRLYSKLGALPDGYWITQKLKETRILIEQCSGLFIDATTNQPFAVQTDSLRINVVLNNRLGADIQLRRVSVDDLDTGIHQALAKNRNFIFAKTIHVPASKPFTQPYWLENKMKEGYFEVKDQRKIGQADVDPAFRVDLELSIEGQELSFHRDLKYRFTDPVKGDIYEPLVVTTPVDVEFARENNFSIRDSAVEVQVHLKHNLREAARYEFAINHSRDWKAGKEKFVFDPKGAGQASTVSAVFRTAEKDVNERETISIDLRGNRAPLFAGHRRQIAYDHIPDITYYREASANLVQVDLRTYHRKIGYIVGAGDKVPEALEQMGYEVTLLTSKELARNSLDQFDAIITGVRAYNTNTWMNDYHGMLMDYVSRGGNLIVQYNTSSNIGPVRAKIGPYDFNISRTRVTDEMSPVTFLKPEHPVFNFPNKITQHDFAGWVQERSIYHAANWDKAKFETVLSMNDPGEKPDEGGLVIARHGEGVFVYTGLVFFRELPAGVPGAYRLLANIIALNKRKAF